MFRPEAISSSSDRLSRPGRLLGVSDSHMVLFAAALIAAALLFSLLVQVPRRELARGEIVERSGMQIVTAPRAAVVEKIYVQQGQYVAQGQPIAKLTADLLDGDGKKMSDASKQSALSELSIAKRQTELAILDLSRKRRALLSQIDVTRSAVLHEENLRRGQRAALDLAREDLEAVTRIAAKGFASRMQQRKYEATVLQWEGELEQAAINSGRLSSDLSTALVALSDNETAARRAVLELKETTRRIEDKKTSARFESGLTVAATRSGYISNIDSQEGERVAAGQLIGLISTGAPEVTEARVWVPNRASGMIHAGSKVNVMIDAFPTERFGVVHGVVTEVSMAGVSPENLPSFLQSKENQFPIKVMLRENAALLDGKRHAFLPGMQLQADIILERRSLLAWLFSSSMRSTVRFASAEDSK